MILNHLFELWTYNNWLAGPLWNSVEDGPRLTSSELGWVRLNLDCHASSYSCQLWLVTAHARPWWGRYWYTWLGQGWQGPLAAWERQSLIVLVEVNAMVNNLWGVLGKFCSSFVEVCRFVFVQLKLGTWLNHLMLPSAVSLARRRDIHTSEWSEWWWWVLFPSSFILQFTFVCLARALGK